MQVDVKTNIREVLARMETYRKDVVEKAVPRALTRTGEMAMTAGSRDLRQDGYNFSAKEIKDAMRQAKASQGRLITTIKVRRQTKSLMSFSPKQTKDGVRVKVHGQAKVIKGAFIAQLRNGAYGVFIEDKAAGKTILRHAKQYKRGSQGGWHDYPVRKLYGPSVGGTYANERIQAALLRFIGTTFSDRLAHEIKNLSR